tara:strand:+ start:69 stop:1196 length:1128 start_codon:yes stop_codon:yes gene_type:complete
MKKIIFRKLLSDCLIFFLISVIGISSIIWVFQAVNFLDIMIEDGRNYSVYLFYTLLNLPKIISKVLPFCIFLGFSYIFIKYEMNNEMIIFWNHGVNKIQLINFFFLFSILILILQSVLLTIVVPKSQELARGQLRSSDVDYFEGLIKPKKFNDTIKNLTIFADEKNSKDEFVNIYIKKKTANNKFQITFAKKGVFEEKGGKKILVLYDGQNLNSNNGKITNFEFSKSDFGLANMDSHLVVHKKLQEQSTMILIDCIKSIYFQDKKLILNCDQNNPRDVYKEAFKRFITPLYLPLLILITSMNFLISKESKKYFRNRFLIFLSGIVTIIISESSLGYINNIFTKNIFLISIPLIVIFCIYFVLLYKLKIRIPKTEI